MNNTFKQVMKNKSDKELLKVINSKEDYRPESLKAAEEEIKKRGLILSKPSSPPKKKNNLKEQNKSGKEVTTPKCKNHYSYKIIRFLRWYAFVVILLNFMSFFNTSYEILEKANWKANKMGIFWLISAGFLIVLIDIWHGIKKKERLFALRTITALFVTAAIGIFTFIPTPISEGVKIGIAILWLPIVALAWRDIFNPHDN